MEELTPYLAAWRVMRLGTREAVDALVRPAHAGGSPELGAALDRWAGRWYWADRARTRLVAVRPVEGAQGPRWPLHVLLFVLTVICALAAGAALAGVWYPW